MAGHQHWLIAEHSHITTLTLHRPQANNSLTPETLSELRLITADLNARDDIWAVVVEGSGDHFSAGVDIGIIQSLLDQPENAAREQLREMQLALDEFESEDLEIDAQAQLLHSQDLREAVESYLAKREPRFTGR
jgi:enoyl-CoA hydratase/carnithine racemase